MTPKRTHGSHRVPPTETPWGLQVSAGAGPREVRVFVGALVQPLREALAARGLVVTHTELRGAPEAPCSATLWFYCRATPDVRGLVGTHEWLSPLRGKRARKRWFAGVSLVAPSATPARAPAPIDPADVEVTACRSGGPGGQHVNRTQSAVQLHHRPSGLRVRAEGERSQRRNLAAAWERLAHALSAVATEQHAAREAARRLEHWRVVRGAPVRTWRFDVDEAPTQR